MKEKSLIPETKSEKLGIEVKKNTWFVLKTKFQNAKNNSIAYILMGLILFCSLILNILLFMGKSGLENEVHQLAEDIEEGLLTQSQNLSQAQDSNELLEQEESNLENLYNDLKQRPSIDSFSDFERFSDLEKHMNDMFSNFDNQFNNQFEVNIIPKGSTYMNFSNTYTVNGKTFHYNIQVDGNNINGKISSDDTELLNKYAEKLKKMGMTVEVEGNEAKFAGIGMNIDAVLEAFQIKSNMQTPKTEEEIFF